MNGGKRIKFATAIGIIIGVLVLFAAAIRLQSQRASLAATQAALQGMHQRALYDMAKHTDNLQVHLSKATVASSTPQSIFLLTAAWNEADAVVENLGQLPLAGLNLSRTFTFFSQVADYSYSLAKKQATGEPLSSSELQKLSELTQHVKQLSSSFHELRDKWGKGNIPLVQPTTPRGGGAATAAAQAAGFSDGFAKIDERLQNEIPTLTYDGPFSDHVIKRKPKMLEGAAQINSDQAIDIALRFLEKNRAELKDVRVDPRSAGNLPTYKVSIVEMEGGEPVHVDVSKAGGQVVLTLKPRFPAQASLSIADATSKGADFLRRKGFTDMVPTGFVREDNTVLVSFVSQSGGALIYPDMIKTRVALDNGEILSFDALNYVMSHSPRTLPKPKLTPDQAKAKVSSRIQPERVRLALIPTPSYNEVLTYEILGRSPASGDRFLVYVNAEDGREEMIMKLLDTDEGTLTL
ncbi:MAG TPA: germination protein YpeB [Firmicutes bacterium]|nr:germination protein YpeB [Bacillota bacterium]